MRKQIDKLIVNKRLIAERLRAWTEYQAAGLDDIHEVEKLDADYRNANIGRKLQERFLELPAEQPLPVILAPIVSEVDHGHFDVMESASTSDLPRDAAQEQQNSKSPEGNGQGRKERSKGEGKKGKRPNWITQRKGQRSQRQTRKGEREKGRGEREKRRKEVSQKARKEEKRAESEREVR